MENIKIIKTIEKMPLEKGVKLCIQVLKKPEGISQKDFSNQIKEDLMTGKKFFRIRELTLKKG